MTRVWLTRVSLCALMVLVTGLVASPQLAHAEDDTVTTELQPGLNLVGWTEAGTNVQTIFDRIPELELVYAWYAPRQRFRWAARTDSGVLGNLHGLTPGMGLWLFVSGEQTLKWTRPVVEHAGFLFLYRGWNLVAWTGQAEAPANLGLQDLDHILIASADATGAEPTSLVRGGAIWLNVSARIRWGQPTTPAGAAELEAIKDLPWVRDGLTDRERGHVDRLREIGERSSQAFRAIITGGWIEEDLPLHRTLVLGDLGSVARVHHRAVALIASLPFLDSLENEDVRVVDALRSIVVRDRAGAADFLSVLGSHDNAASLSSIDVWLAYLDFKDRSAADGLRQLAWFQDGIPEFEGERVDSYLISDNLEYWTVRDLVSVFSRSPRLYLALVQKEWMNDPLDRSRSKAVDRINGISYAGSGLALDILEMPFLETFERADLAALGFLQELEWYDREGLRALVSHYSEGGIADEDLAMLRGQYLKIHDPPTAAVLQALAWVKDGISESEESAALALQRLALDHTEVFLAVAAVPWLRDGLDADELVVVGAFGGLASTSPGREDVDLPLQVLDMPFLETVDGSDSVAMGGVVALARQGNGEALLMVLAHPTFEKGIADEHADVLVALSEVARYKPELLASFLEPDAIRVDRATVELSHAGNVQLAVIHLGPEQTGTMAVLEEAIRDQDTFMMTAFPRSYVAVLVGNLLQTRGGGGPGGILHISPGSAEDRHLIAHELAHTYWPFYPPWIAEGAAEFMANRFAGPQLLGACPIADTLGELDRLAQENIDQGRPSGDVYRSTGCAYALGSSLFVDLYRAVGDEAFRQGFRRLYLAMKDETHNAVCSGVEKGVCYVKQAFVTNAAPEAAALAEPVINQRYYGDPEGPAPDPR